MKTMREIVDSIENPKMRALATELMEKLEGVRGAIQDKRKKGEPVTETENASLKASVANYVKKGLSVALVTAMLTTCLASCEMGKNPEKTTNNGVGGDDTKIEEVETDYPKAKLVVKEPVTTSISADECSLGALKAFDLTDILTDSESFSELDSLYKGLLSAEEYYDKDNTTAMLALCLWKMADNNDNHRRVMFLQDDEQTGWSHELVSSETGLLMVSNDKNGNGYLTGLVEGSLRNDLGLISDEQIAIFKDLATEMSYIEIVDYTRKNFFGDMYEEILAGRLRYEMYIENKEVEGKGIPFAKARIQMQQLFLPEGSVVIRGEYTNISDTTYKKYYAKESQAE